MECRTVGVDASATLQQLGEASGLLIKLPQSRALRAAQPCLDHQNSTFSVVTAGSAWLVRIMRSALQTPSTPVLIPAPLSWLLLQHSGVPDASCTVPLLLS